MRIPQLKDHVPELVAFVRDLSGAVEAGAVADADALERRVRAFFTPEQMAQANRLAPTWNEMASYQGGTTLIHIMSVLVALLQLPEYRAATPDQQALMRWIVFFHDVAKRAEIGHRDLVHGFRSAAVTAKALPDAGFPVSGGYHEHIQRWVEMTCAATTSHPDHASPVQDNRKLPAILGGIDLLFGWRTSASLVVQAVLLHMSINVVEPWPQAAPLSDAEIGRYLSPPLVPLLRAMMLTDNDAWHLFEPEMRRDLRAQTLTVFARVEALVAARHT